MNQTNRRPGVDMANERERIEQSNDVAAIVFAEHKKAFPDLHPVLDLRYGIADALWDAGYRRASDRFESTLADLARARKDLEYFRSLPHVSIYTQLKQERDEAREVIEKVRNLPTYQAEESGGVYDAVDSDDLAAIIATYDQQEKADG